MLVTWTPQFSSHQQSYSMPRRSLTLIPKLTEVVLLREAKVQNLALLGLLGQQNSIHRYTFIVRKNGEGEKY